MKQSTELDQIAKALSIAQGQMSNAIKDSDNPFFKSKYADLTSVWDACREPLSKNGLSVTQILDLRETGGLVLHSTLLHSSGQWITSTMPVTPTKNDPQGMGSAITYCRRFALAALVGVSPEDDDGNHASTPSKNIQTQKIAPRSMPGVKKISLEQLKDLTDMAVLAGQSNEQMRKHVRSYGVEKAPELSEENYVSLVATLQLEADYRKNHEDASDNVPLIEKDEDEESE